MLLPLSYNLPGRWGINLQEKDRTLHPNWCTKADHLVLNESFRLQARGGYTVVSTDNANGELLRGFIYIDADGAETVITSQSDRIVSGVGDLDDASTDITSTTTPSAGYWQFVNFNGKVLGFQDGEAPIVKTTGDFADISASGTLPDGDCAVAAYGRVWAVDDDRQTIRYSVLLDETDWQTANGAGSIDMRNVWTDGIDYVTALAAFNGTLVVFGRRHIIIYADGQGSVLGVDPDQMYVVDTIEGTGCVARDTVTNIGEGDLLFLSTNGLQSLRRLILQKDNPLDTISWQIHDELIARINAALAEQSDAADDCRAFTGCYIPETGQYWLFSYKSAAIRRYIFHLTARTEDDLGREVVPITIIPHKSGLLNATRWAVVTNEGVVYQNVFSGGAQVASYDPDGTTDQSSAAIDVDFESGWLDHQNQSIDGRRKDFKYAELTIKNDAQRASVTSFKFASDYSATLSTVAAPSRADAITVNVYDPAADNAQGQHFKFGMSDPDFGGKVLQQVSLYFRPGYFPASLNSSDDYSAVQSTEDAGAQTTPVLLDPSGSPLNPSALSYVFAAGNDADNDEQVVTTGHTIPTNADGLLVFAVSDSGSQLSTIDLDVGISDSGSLGTLHSMIASSGGTGYAAFVGYIPLDGVTATQKRSGEVRLLGNVPTNLNYGVIVIPVLNGGTAVASNTDIWVGGAQNLTLDAVLDDVSLTTSYANAIVILAAVVYGNDTAAADTYNATIDDTSNFSIALQIGGFPESYGSSLFVWIAPAVADSGTVLSPDVTFSDREGGDLDNERSSVSAFEVPTS